MAYVGKNSYKGKPHSPQNRRLDKDSEPRPATQLQLQNLLTRFGKDGNDKIVLKGQRAGLATASSDLAELIPEKIEVDDQQFESFEKVLNENPVAENESLAALLDKPKLWSE